VDLDGPLHPDLHDGVGSDLGRYELVAGAHHDLDRQHDRARTDPPQLAPRNKVRNSVSGFCPSGLWNDRVESSRAYACLVACGWFGIQAWIGGQAIHIFLGSFIPGWQTLLGGAIGGHTPTEWLSFLLFWGINIFIIYRGMDLLRHVENWAAPFVLVMTTLLLAWIVYQAGGLRLSLERAG
jgi:hypothetical protein